MRYWAASSDRRCLASQTPEPRSHPLEPVSNQKPPHGSDRLPASLTADGSLTVARKPKQ